MCYIYPKVSPKGCSMPEKRSLEAKEDQLDFTGVQRLHFSFFFFFFFFPSVFFNLSEPYCSGLVFFFSCSVLSSSFFFFLCLSLFESLRCCLIFFFFFFFWGGGGGRGEMIDGLNTDIVTFLFPC